MELLSSMTAAGNNNHEVYLRVFGTFDVAKTHVASVYEEHSKSIDEAVVKHVKGVIDMFCDVDESRMIIPEVESLTNGLRERIDDINADNLNTLSKLLHRLMNFEIGSFYSEVCFNLLIVIMNFKETGNVTEEIIATFGP